MIIDFNEETHTYSINGDIASISVTELLAKHHLSPSYDGVDKKLIKKAAEEGKKVHADLEKIFNEEKYELETEQGRNFEKWVKENVKCGVAEQKLGFEYNGLTIAGTADVMGFLKDDTLFVGDHKNTSQFNREYVSWQVSLYDYFARQLKGEKLNGNPFNWEGAKKFYCFHYDKKDNGKMTVYELDKIPDSEIERLIQCEYKGEIYARKELVVAPELELEFAKRQKALIRLKKQVESAEKRMDAVKDKLIELFEQQGILQWKTDNLTVTYIAPTEIHSIDSGKLKRELPQVFDKYQKTSKRKATVRITVNDYDVDTLDALIRR